MSLAALLIVVGLILWLLVPHLALIGLIVLIVGVCFALWAASSFRGGGPRRYWY